MNRTRSVAIAITILIGMFGGWILSTQVADADDAKGCEGLARYRVEMLETGREYVTDREDAGISFGRDPLTLSSSEWEQIAVSANTYQAHLKDIEAPAWASHWHQAQIEGVGLLEQIARMVSKEGLLAVIAFEEQLNANEEERSIGLDQANLSCADFEEFHLEWDALDGEIEGSDTEPTGDNDAVASIPLGVNGSVAEKWEITVVNFYETASLIDPDATWFTDWIKENPAPEGEQVVAIRIVVRNIGATADYPLRDLSFAMVSASGFEYVETCGNPPEAMTYSDQLDTGGETIGVLCWNVRTEHVPTLRLRVRSLFAIDDNETLYFSTADVPGTPLAS